MPVVFVTAWYGLCQLARLGRGETVLIHSAAGGVGGAAIQLAQRAGANIIATAGTKEKRTALKQFGVKHVFDSRSLDFYNQVMQVTDGRGVDVVLNSLTGRFIAQSLKCLGALWPLRRDRQGGHLSQQQAELRNGFPGRTSPISSSMSIGWPSSGPTCIAWR